MERWQLKQMQSLPLDVKIEKSKQRIIEWYERYEGQVYISFSGGKDSTVLLNLVRSIYPEVPAVFVDTGLEYPEIRDIVKGTDNVVWLRPKVYNKANRTYINITFKEVLDIYGFPVISKEQAQYISEYRTTKSDKLKAIRWLGNKWGRGKISEKWKVFVDAPFNVSDKCCNIMKKTPAKIFEKETGRKPFIGKMAEESEKEYKTIYDLAVMPLIQTGQLLTH